MQADNWKAATLLQKKEKIRTKICGKMKTLFFKIVK